MLDSIETSTAEEIDYDREFLAAVRDSWDLANERVERLACPPDKGIKQVLADMVSYRTGIPKAYVWSMCVELFKRESNINALNESRTAA